MINEPRHLQPIGTKRGAYSKLSPQYLEIVDYFCYFDENVARLADSSIRRSASCATQFLYHLQEKGITALGDVKEDDIRCFFIKDGKPVYMSTIRGYSQSNYYDSADNDYSAYNQNASSFLAGLSINSGAGNNNGIMGGINLSDYASIKNGSYGKLVKAYYAKQKADSVSSGRDSSAKLTSMGSAAGTLAKSAGALMKDSLWEKKQIKTKDEKTGEETTKEDYDWDSITKAVKSFAYNYNKTIESAGSSNTKDVLRNAAWMTKTTKSTERLLERVGISVGADNKLELDEDAIKKADISTLKSVFTGYNSFASKVYDKAQSMTNAAARAGGTYTSTGNYSDVLSSILPSNIDKKE